MLRDFFRDLRFYLPYIFSFEFGTYHDFHTEHGASYVSSGNELVICFFFHKFVIRY